MENKIQKNTEISKVQVNLDKIIDEIDEAFGFFGRAFIQRDLIVSKLNGLKSSLPSEFKEAQDILNKKQEIIDSANIYSNKIAENAKINADSIIASAQKQAEYLVSNTYVFKQAQIAANKMMEESNKAAMKTIEYANEYASETFNNVLNAIDYFQQEVNAKRNETFSNLEKEHRKYESEYENAHKESELSDAPKENYSYDNSNYEYNGYEDSQDYSDDINDDDYSRFNK